MMPDVARFDGIPAAECRVTSCNIAVRLMILQSQQLLAQLRVAPQRLALPAGGRDETRFRNGQNSKPQKSQFGDANPAVRVHAVLGGFVL